MGEPRQYSDLPKSVIAFLSRFEAIDFVSALIEKYGVGDRTGNTSDVLAIIDKVALGELTIDAIPDMLSTLLGTTKEQSLPAAAEFVGSQILPFADILGIDVDTPLRSWGADPAAYKDVKRVLAEEEKPSPEEEKPKGAGFSDPVMQHRLELIVASYRDGVRTREQAVSVLMRPVKTGGLEMSEGAAGEVLALVSAELEEPPGFSATLVASSETGRDGTKVPGNQAEVAGAKADSFTSEDEEEIKKVAAEKKATMEMPVLVTDTKAAADRIGSDAKLSFASGELKTRFEHIIDARLRDVRDGFQTRAKLEAPPEQGGVGLSGAKLVAVMEMVERMDEMHHKALAAEMAAKKQQAQSDRFDRKDRSDRIREQEEQVMAKRYAEITGKAPQQIVTPTPARTTVAMPAAELIRARERNIDTAKVKAAIEAAKAPAPVVTPILSESSIPQAASGRPKVEDIRFERKLSGPVEELRLLTLTDFRRLSKDPKQAILRVQDKVEIAAHEGYDRRIAAIKAWRESPLSQLYLALSREALTAGKGVAQILEEKRALGQDVPSDEELKAIVELNGILRF